MIPESPIRKLAPLAEEAKKKGRKIFQLNIGQPDIPTLPEALDAVRTITHKVIEYSHSAGNETYRKKLAGYYRDHGIDIDHTNILVTTGGSEAILFAMLSCLDPGDEVIVPEPYYANYNGFAVAAGIKIIPVTSFIEQDFSLPPVEEFEKRIGPRTRGVIICNPNNPTGYLYSAEELEKIRKLIIKHDLCLFSDEVYREFCYDGAVHIPSLNLEGTARHVVMVDSISKRYSACGVRIGTLVSRNMEVIRTALKLGQARLSPPGFGQIFGEAALDTITDEYFSTVSREYVQRRNFLVEALNEMEGVLCPKPKGAFYAMARLPVDNADRFVQWLLTDFEYKNQTLMLAPASGFYSDPGLGTREVRIAYVLNIEDLRDAMICLERALREYPGRKIK